jgi:mannose/cellobiose epimerase-like protein (N-acyl-D-glucosamine 2-epimerase family)
MIVKDELQLTEAVLAETERAGDPRFKEIVQALVRHLHDFAREVRLTEAEFDASINIVARLGQLTTPSHHAEAAPTHREVLASVLPAGLLAP